MHPHMRIIFLPPSPGGNCLRFLLHVVARPGGAGVGEEPTTQQAYHIVHIISISFSDSGGCDPMGEGWFLGNGL